MTVRIVDTIISVADWTTVKVKVISTTRSLHKATVSDGKKPDGYLSASSQAEKTHY